MNAQPRLRRLLALGLLAALLVVAAQALASPLANGPAIDWWVVAGGGGHAAGGNITIDDTLGQPIAGPSAGGTVSLGAGYWYGAGQTYTLNLPVVLRISAGR